MKKIRDYRVARLRGSLTVNGQWDKSAWQNAMPLEIAGYMGAKPRFFPVVHAKMMYDDRNLYVIFHVEDQYVRCITKEFNGPVWEDSCVEFFFSPDAQAPERYFNLEINCGGTPLMHYCLIPRKRSIHLDADDIRKIEISHTMPQIIDPEIADPVTWSLEYRIPMDMIAKYSGVTTPGPGVQWRANFYKIAENNSNPHYLTWSPVINNVPDFHMPEFFGTITFE